MGSAVPSGGSGGANQGGGAGTPATASGGAATGGSVTGGAAGAGASGLNGVGGSNAGEGGSSPGDGGSSNAGSGEPAGGAAGSSSLPGTDAFGILQLYPSAPSGAAWDALHWSQSGAYSISERRDDNDPLGLSGMRGEGTLLVEDGELVMSGSQPRIYVYPSEGQEWLNVEVTVYYQRVADQDTSYAGLVVGVRSGPDGHTSETPCEAHTYYSRLRNDGSADFEKELEHSPSSTRESTSLEDFLPPDGEASAGTWIGWKYVSYNLPGEDALKLEAYIDLTEGENGGDWRLVNETVDAGGWFTDTGCPEYAPVDGESDFVWLDGGTVFIRNTDVEEARYRSFSIREIVVPE
jgi:hypothetical protein